MVEDDNEARRLLPHCCTWGRLGVGDQEDVLKGSLVTPCFTCRDVMRSMGCWLEMDEKNMTDMLERCSLEDEMSLMGSTYTTPDTRKKEPTDLTINSSAQPKLKLLSKCEEKNNPEAGTPVKVRPSPAKQGSTPKPGPSTTVTKTRRWVKLPSGLYGWRKETKKVIGTSNNSAHKSKDEIFKQRANPQTNTNLFLKMDQQATRQLSDGNNRK